MMERDDKSEVTLPENKDAQPARPVDDRRAALKKLGRFGLYTAPAMLAMFEPTRAPAASRRRLGP